MLIGGSLKKIGTCRAGVLATRRGHGYKVRVMGVGARAHISYPPPFSGMFDFMLFKYAAKWVRVHGTCAHTHVTVARTLT